MKCFLRCPLAGNTTQFWQEAVFPGQEICCVKRCPPPLRATGSSSVLLVSERKTSAHWKTVHVGIYFVWMQVLARVSSHECVGVSLAFCLCVPLFWGTRVDSCGPKSSCLLFCLEKLVTLSKVQPRKPNVYTALTFKRTKDPLEGRCLLSGQYSKQMSWHRQQNNVEYYQQKLALRMMPFKVGEHVYACLRC